MINKILSNILDYRLPLLPVKEQVAFDFPCQTNFLVTQRFVSLSKLLYTHKTIEYLKSVKPNRHKQRGPPLMPVMKLTQMLKYPLWTQAKDGQVFKITVFAGGHGTFLGLINTFVHIIMYTYYLLAALGPTVQKYLWWKKYLTILQMVRHNCVCWAGYKTAIFIASLCRNLHRMYIIMLWAFFPAEYWKIIQANIFISKQVPSVGSHLPYMKYSRNEQGTWCE